GLLEAVREAPAEVSGALRETDDREDLIGGRPAATALEAQQLGVQQEHLPGGHPGLVAEELRQVADLRAGRPVAQRGTEDLARSAARPRQTEKQLHGGRLAGAVGAQEAEDIVSADSNVKTTRTLDR